MKGEEKINAKKDIDEEKLENRLEDIMRWDESGFQIAASKVHHDEHEPDDENRDPLRKLFRFPE